MMDMFVPRRDPRGRIKTRARGLRQSAVILRSTCSEVDTGPALESGSQIRLSGSTPTLHSLTVPDHSPLKVGTAHAILADVAAHQRSDKADLNERLFS